MKKAAKKSAKKKEVTIESLAGTMAHLVETVDNLALMTQRGFERNDKRFDSVELRLERIEQLVDGHDSRLDKLEDKMRRIITIFEKKLEIPFPR